jgi:uncharacterized protein YndB with AHSA1/START domain
MNLPFLISTPGDAVVVVEGDFNANVEHMYRAWTEPNELMKWFGPSKGALTGVDIALHVGGRVCFEFVANENKRSAIEGVYLEIEPNKKIVFTWSHIVVRPDGDEKITPQSRVTVTFTANGDRTHVRLCHEGIATQDGRDGVSHGWNGAMRQLQFYCGGESL